MSSLNKVLLTLLLGLSLAVPARAAVDPHRTSDTQTSWYWYYNVTAEELTGFINETESRIIDLEIHDTEPLTFTAALVRNQGDYASGWWWYYGLSFDEVGRFVVENNARLIDIERYEVGGSERFAAVMVPNTGSQAKTWWYYAGVTPTEITDYINANEARLTDIESYLDSAGARKYAVIMIRNAGEDYTPWGWFFNTDAATVSDYMAENNLRMLEFEVRNSSTPTLDAIMISNDFHTPATWWWYYNLTATEVGELASQNGSRIVDINPYLVGTSYRYNIVMLNNSNSLTVEVADILDWGRDGATGLYLRDIDGQTLASLQSEVQFEPASTLKVIHNFHAMRQVMMGNVFLNTPIPFTSIYSGSCPVGPDDSVAALQSVLTAMMVNSDNAATKGIADYFGASIIENTARNIAGMTSTELNHTLGCGDEAVANPNRLTLRDAGMLYEGVQELDLLSPQYRDLFYSVMQNQDTAGPWWFTTDLFNLVDDEAANQGYQFADSFKAGMEFAWKPGGYTFEYPVGEFHEYVSVAGIVTLPYCADGWEKRSYVFGVFCDDADNPPFDKVRAAATELFRDLVAYHLRLCPTPVPGADLTATLELEPNVPNPFNPRTDVYFRLAEAGQVQLTIHDLAGREVARLAGDYFEPGRHAVTWNGRDQQGRDVASGTYFARIRSGNQEQSRKLVLLR